MVSNPSNSLHNDARAPRIDLHSDTCTLPSAQMREAMAHAAVGNEQAQEDPTVNKLCRMVADLMGKEAAIFLPSGTMCNEIAYRVWVDHGEEIILDESSHGLHFETGGPAALSGAMTRPIAGDRGLFTAEQMLAAIRPASRHAPRTALVSVENTANMGGGTIWPLAQLEAVAAAAHDHNLPVHMDGARLLNAVVASGVSAAAFSQPCDSVWLDLSKGLGCPVGGVLAGSADFIDRAWRFKHQFGGAMRQAGIIAAAGVFALEHNVARLAEDHLNAQKLAHGLAAIDGIDINVSSVETNMVYFGTANTGHSASDFSAALREYDVRITNMGPDLMRAVTHLDIDAAMIEETITACAKVAASPA